MPSKPVRPDPLEQIHELNRLFLKSLKARAAEGMRAARLPAGAFDALKAADHDQLDLVAEFPRALFELLLDDSQPPSRPAQLELGPGANRILEITVSYCVWSTCRDSIYHARLFFGLGTEVIHTFRTTPLSELPRLALTRVRIVCAFTEVEWLWTELLREMRPEARRQLILVALQPSLRAPADVDGVAGRAR